MTDVLLIIILYKKNVVQRFVFFFCAFSFYIIWSICIHFCIEFLCSNLFFFIGNIFHSNQFPVRNKRQFETLEGPSVSRNTGDRRTRNLEIGGGRFDIFRHRLAAHEFSEFRGRPACALRFEMVDIVTTNIFAGPMQTVIIH